MQGYTSYLADTLSANFPPDFIAPTTPRLFLGRQFCAAFDIFVEASDD
jgi:hypothetical protein